MNLIKFTTSSLDLPERSIKNTLELLSNDATIPFIARYRKEATGNLNEVEIEQIANLVKLFRDLETRKTTILKAIEEHDEMTPELQEIISNTSNLAKLEDLYLPYKKKRKTKAGAAREAGLDELARRIFAQSNEDPVLTARQFLNKQVNSIDDALQGAKYIIAEDISEDIKLRSRLRNLYALKAIISTKVVKKEISNPNAQNYKQYFDWEEPLKNIPSHRLLAIYRANKEGFIRLKIEVDTREAVELISNHCLISKSHRTRDIILDAVEDAYSRLLKPSFGTEFLTAAKVKADEAAILVFANNLEQLLLSPPLGSKRILAIDPGFKSGCKVVCLDENGSLLHNETIFPHPPQRDTLMASKKIRSLVNAYKIEALAIGNGTASRETEFFIKNIPLPGEISVYTVNEAGASIYSASQIAREEFPNYDITVRGAVSIGRRLSDPLAEYVKIDPKSIGVGQYQHEVDQNKLKDKLDSVVVKCVNKIGVNVNTASKELLSYVSGVGPSLAENIIEFRKQNGALKSRKDLTNIPRLGAKSFEQAAGFLRIPNAKNPLDNSAVHPESYSLVHRIAVDLKLKVAALVGNKTALAEISPERYCTDKIGVLTLKDILKELEKPGADPRKDLIKFEFDPSIKTIEDLQVGMTLRGIANNITNFGCFVDIGIKESGLIHISKLAKGFVSDVSSIVKLNDQIKVTVLEIDVLQKRIQLSLID